MALAFEAAEREACPNCGTREQDWLDADGIPHDPPRLMAKPRKCEGCAERATTRMAIERGAREAHGTGDSADYLIASALAGVSVPIVAFTNRPNRPEFDDEED